VSISGALRRAAAVVAVDVGKAMAAVLVTDAARRQLFGPVDFPMTGRSESRGLIWVLRVDPTGNLVST